MESLSETSMNLSPEQRQEVFNIGREFAFEDGLSFENYKRQYPNVPEDIEKAVFMEGFLEGKRITDSHEISNGLEQGFGRHM